MTAGNQLLNFCVGVAVGGHDATNLSNISKNSQELPHLLIPMSSQGVTREKWSCMKNRQKMEITGVKIAWVDVKSTKYPFLHK